MYNCSYRCLAYLVYIPSIPENCFWVICIIPIRTVKPDSVQQIIFTIMQYDTDMNMDAMCRTQRHRVTGSCKNRVRRRKIRSDRSSHRVHRKESRFGVVIGFTGRKSRFSRSRNRVRLEFTKFSISC